MTEAILDRLILGFSVGLTLVVMAGATLFMGQRRIGWRLLAAVIGAGLCPCIALAVGRESSASAAFAASMVGALGMWALQGPWLVTRLSVAVQGLGRPVGNAALSASLGFGLMAASYCLLLDSDRDDLVWHDLESLHARPALHVVDAEELAAWTDLGTPIPLLRPNHARPYETIQESELKALGQPAFMLRAIRSGPPDDRSNCFGWVFTGGGFWISQDSVAAVLEENGYQLVSDPRPGDLVIYRNQDEIRHAAVVYAVNPKGDVLVEGKWGHFGVFVHRANECGYGSEFAFYRSERLGHLLAGLSGNDATPER